MIVKDVNKLKMESKFIFRIIEKSTETPVGVYSKSYHDRFDFNSADEALESNCHGVFKNREKYKIVKYRVTYELIDDLAQ